MRNLFSISLAVIVGLALGTGMAGLHLQRTRWSGDPDVSRPTAPPIPPAAEGVPKASTESVEYEFGQMDSGEERKHDFIITNTGTGPLTLKVGTVSCRCTAAVVDATAIPPGKSGKVTISWKAKEVIGPYRQTVTILTNDPGRMQILLAVKGEITVGLRNDPAELIFSRIALGEPASGNVRLWCYLTGSALKIVDYKLSDPATSQYFAVTHEPVSAAELSQEKRAKSGVVLHVAVKPGLPQGQFQQTILLATNLEAEPAITVPIKGTIGSDVNIAGPGWNPDLGELNLGTVNRKSGGQHKLLLIARGQYAKKVSFKVTSVKPDFLHVKLEETTAAGSGNLTQTPIVIQIPENSPSESHLGLEQGELGEILLETTHPRVPKLRILVRFAVEG